MSSRPLHGHDVRWLLQVGVGKLGIARGGPLENGLVEPLDGRFRGHHTHADPKDREPVTVMRNDELSLLFVYGTLMRDGCRAKHLAGQQYLGDVSTEPRYRMFDCGSYPGLVEDESGGSIVGELWDVSVECLQQLDRVEGVDESLYERRSVQLHCSHAERIVEAYFYLPSTTGMRDCGRRWNNEDQPATE